LLWPGCGQPVQVPIRPRNALASRTTSSHSGMSSCGSRISRSSAFGSAPARWNTARMLTADGRRRPPFPSTGSRPSTRPW